ncbi:MAG: hypothetical protein F6K40_03375 [Okeania sp. SIO3I5]|uniref:hypothetical protein n=1 Tax=Okeania sp. SIO3I5 TaxID=2607805 RepID=UPI0013B81938|nr:hypothetical protein [Okeania sp. SIO3I5]NEQ35400.1 hypothetical protein [Okeania sp. SIO3I5]
MVECISLPRYLVNMSNNDREDKIQVNFQLARSKWESFQVKCKNNGASISEVLQFLIELYLAEEIDNYQTILSVSLATKVDAEIGKYIGNKLDRYIDKYIEKKLIQGIEKIDDPQELVTTKNNNKLINVGNNSEIVREKYQEKKVLTKETIDQKEVKKNQFSNEGKELKTARELAKLFGCSAAYITTLNRLGDLQKRGWRDSGKRQGKAILYQQI